MCCYFVIMHLLSYLQKYWKILRDIINTQKKRYFANYTETF